MKRQQANLDALDGQEGWSFEVLATRLDKERPLILPMNEQASAMPIMEALAGAKPKRKRKPKPKPKPQFRRLCPRCGSPNHYHPL